MMKTEPLSGWWLSFTDEESVELQEGLRSLGYTTDSAGLKDFIFDSLSYDPQEEKRERDETLAGHINQFLKSNPEIVGMYSNMGKAALNMAAMRIMQAMAKAKK